MKWLLSAVSFSMFLTAQPLRAETQNSGYSFGVPPQQSVTELTKRWTPIMQYLSAKSGVELRLKTTKDIQTFHQALMDGVFDVAYVNPNTYISANKNAGYRAFAKERGGKTTGLIVVKRDGQIKELAQLNGQTLAFPSKNAVLATLVPLRGLEGKGVKVNEQYVVSMDSVYLAVAKGLFVAGGGESRTFGGLDPEVKKQLTVLWESQEFPSFPFFAHPRMPKEIVAKVQKVMASMDENPEGLALLKTINFQGMDIADDADYNGVRAMNIKSRD